MRESKWHKPFLTTKMNAEETIDYIRCMTLTPNVDESVYERITKKDLDKILNYIDDSHKQSRANINYRHHALDVVLFRSTHSRHFFCMEGQEYVK